MLKRQWFGVDIGTEVDELSAKLWCFLFPKTAASMGCQYSATKEDWFWEVVYHLWGPKNPKGVKFVAHPWAEQMVVECCAKKEVGLSGCASSGKSDFLAVWGCVNWLAAPLQTKVFMTSTSLGEARGRIWGKLLNYWRGASVNLDGYGKFLDSIGTVRSYRTSDGGKRVTSGDTCGIQLIAGERSQEKDAVGKLIGFKQTKILFLADELAELTPSLLEACFGNLMPGNPDPKIPKSLDHHFGFQLVAASNFKSYIDSFGNFVEPKTGWKSINIDSTRWETKRGGVCLRFDGLKSPNLSLSEDKWPIYGRKNLVEHEKLGRNTVQFWRMCRSFPAPEGVADVIYSQQELMTGGAFGRPVWSERPLIRLAAIDPAFTSGGDRSVVIIGTLGYDVNGKRILHRDETIELQEDVTSKDAYDKQIAIQFRDHCKRFGISKQNAAHDATGSGISWHTLLEELWREDGETLPVKFGGSASELPTVNGEQVLPANKVYANRVTEIWYRGKEYVRYGQLQGIDADLAEEGTARHYDVRKGGETMVIAESKKDMRVRISKSPDKWDALMILLDLAVTRHGFMPVSATQVANESEEESVPEIVEKYDEVYSEESAMIGDNI